MAQPTIPVPPTTAAPRARLEELRVKHLRFLYESFAIERDGHALRARFQFRLEPGAEFAPQTTIEGVDWQRVERIPKAALENFFFHLGLIEMLSYWKAACSPVIEVRAGALNAEQIAWWLELLRQGMGEFFYLNQIDFRPEGFVRIVSNLPVLSDVIPRSEATRELLFPQSPPKDEKQIPLPPRRDRDDNIGAGDNGYRDLVLTSGGKDSVVALELLREAQVGQAFPSTSLGTSLPAAGPQRGSPAGREACNHFDCLLLNPTEAALAIARESGCEKHALRSSQSVGGTIIVRRTIDPRLLELNAAGYLNGHTPFSALLAILGVTVAALFGHRRVIVANERSAEEAGVEYLGQPINHQYSKTLQFETAFRHYAQKYLAPGIEYFSLLRPLYELQIARLFANYPQYFPLFRSCNRGMATNTWCGRCPKCLFVFTALYPFLKREQILSIFGADLFAWDGAAEVLRALLGLDRNKPFECVGTREETLAAIYLCVEKYQQQAIALPASLLSIKQTVLSTHPDLPELSRRILTAWTDQHHLPPELTKVIRRGQAAV